MSNDVGARLIERKYSNLESLHLKKAGFCSANGWWDWSFEHILMGRGDCTGYFNNVKGTQRLFAALWQALVAITVAGLIFFLLNLALGLLYDRPASPKEVLQELLEQKYSLIAGAVGFVTLWVTLFARETASMYKKWAYLADLYNKYLETPPLKDYDQKNIDERKPKRYDKRAVILVSLCIDILHLEMWSHRSFRATFRDVLALAIEFKHGEGSMEYCEELNRVVERKFTTKEAQEILGSYQWKLFPPNEFSLRVHNPSEEHPHQAAKVAV